MKKQRTIAALMSAALLCTAGISAIDTTNTTTTPEEEATVVQNTQQQMQETTATITELVTIDEQLSAVVAKQEDEQLIQFNIGVQTIYLDDQTGTSFSAADLKVGDKITVTHGLAMTRSLPPQVFAEAIIRIPAEAQGASAHLLTAEELIAGEDGAVTVLTQNGGLFVHIGKDTPIAPYMTRNIVTAADITPATRFAAWYDVVAMSYPGQATAQRVVILPQQENEQQDKQQEKQQQAQQMIAQAQEHNGVSFVPLRAVAQAAGFTVTWDKASQTATLQNEEMNAQVILNQTQQQMQHKNGEATVISLNAEPIMQQPGTILVPAQFFENLLGTDSFTIVDAQVQLH